jgi:hypothetical protein
MILLLLLGGCEGDGDSTPAYTPMTATPVRSAPFPAYDDLSVQIQGALASDSCAAMYEVHAVQVDRARLTHAAAVVDVDAIASLIATEKLADFDDGVCNTLAWRKRAESFRSMPAGAVVPFAVSASFARADGAWRLESVTLAE